MIRKPLRWLRRAASVAAAPAHVASAADRRRGRRHPVLASVDALESRTLLSGDVVISEFMASNTKTVADQDGDFSDWIEVHNITTAPVSLQGWHLTDDKLQPAKWTFPAVTLPADGYLVVFASGKNRAVAGRQLHTNFSLAAGGEYLALFPPEEGAAPSTVLDPYPRQQPDVSFGFGPSARINSTLLSTPSPATYFIPSGAGVDGWTAPDFDDTAWTPGSTGIGYEQTNAAQPPLPEESEPNDTPGGADDASTNFSPLASGAAQGGAYQIGVKGALDSGGDLDFYNLGPLQLGDRLSVTLSGTGGMRGTLNDCYLQIFRLNGGDPQLVTFSDDDGPGYDSLVNRLSIPADDTYYVEAMSYPASGVTGTYDLGVFLEDVAGSAAPLTGGGVTGEAAPNQDVATATDVSTSWRAVGFRSSTAGTIGNATDADVYRFHFTAGDVVSVVVDSTSQLDGRLSLLDAGGVTVIAQEDGTSTIRDDAASALDSRLYSYVVPTTGDYFVRVQGVSAATGTYRLDVNLSTNTAPPAAAWFSGLIGSDVGAAMRGVSPGAFIRVPFVIGNDAELADVERLTLAMKYDDGFVAYLNGAEIARRNAPDGDAAAAWDAAATSERDNVAASAFETIDVSTFRENLVVGVNVLAIHGLSRGLSDPDFLVLPEVRAVSPLRQPAPGYFTAATPGKVNGAIGAVGSVADTRFDHDRGFYTAPFDLAVTTATEGATIRYTLNGDAPTATTGTVYTGPVRIDKTTTIRAMAFKPGYVSTNIDTQTYIFVDDVIRQSSNGAPPAGWPTTWGSNTRDYGMDPDVVNNVQYRDTIKNDLQTLPTMSLVMDLDDLFNPSNGIYANPSQDGIAWERRASLELINPDGTKGFQADAGVRIRGGFSRSTSNPKHGLRFFFRSEYGQNELDYPLFGPDGAQSFKGFDLRTFQNYSWSFQGDARGIFMRDQLSRDLQLATGEPAPRGNYYHLYINGQYWGLYNTDERPEANFGASYFGGKAADYDTIKVDPDLGYSVEATDGDLAAWTSLWTQLHTGPVNDALYQKLQGNNPDGTPNPSLPVLLDMDNLIDYMLVVDYGGNLDAPVSVFINNNGRPNNFFALRNRTPDARQGFRFFIHDAEHTLLSVTEDRTGPFAAGNDLATSNPQYFFQRLWASPSFKLRVADHIQKHMVDPGGVLTPAKVREALLRRAGEIDRAVVAESARWGDAKVATPFTRNTNWLAEVNRILNSYIPQRTTNVINQLKGDGLYPAFGAPVFNQRGGTVAPGFQLTITPTAATPATAVVYYTLDGSDPRLPDGTVNPNAAPYTSPIPIDAAVTVKARALNGITWSPLAESTFAVDTVPLRVTEIMYNPAPPPEGSAFLRQDFEFVEVQNVGTTELDLSGVRFSNGIGYTFPDGTTLAPGAYAVVTRNAEAFASRYGDGIPVGVFTGGLSDSGERVALSGPGPGLGGAGGPTLLDFAYSDAWQPVTDGAGRSLVARNPLAPPEEWNNPDAWRRSAADGGSPGAADPVLPTTVAGRWLFYNRSGYDGTAAPSPDSSDDNARAVDKVALRPGDPRATPANVSAYSKGINGLFIDLADLPPGAPPTAADLEFRVGRGGNPADWALAPNPTVVALRRGKGVGGSDRLTVVFADGVIKNQWLQVTVKATDRTGLAAPDVFYFGSLVGDVGDTTPGMTQSRINVLDLAQVKKNLPNNNVFMTSRFDIDRDGKINATDLSVIKSNLYATLEMLDLSAPPAGAGARSGASAVAPLPFSVTSVPAPAGVRNDDLLGSLDGSVLD